jgi:cyclic pyranopterin phosphate synthase
LTEETSIELEAVVRIHEKEVLFRRAVATGLLTLQSTTKSAIEDGSVKKGDVLQASTIAAIQAVKETPRIIPHCHPIPIEGVQVDWVWEGNNLRCTVTVEAMYKTGVEMEALTGVSAGLLCVFDMVKSFEKDQHGQYTTACIREIHVISKTKNLPSQNE